MSKLMPGIQADGDLIEMKDLVRAFTDPFKQHRKDIFQVAGSMAD